MLFNRLDNWSLKRRGHDGSSMLFMSAFRGGFKKVHVVTNIVLEIAFLLKNEKFRHKFGGNYFLPFAFCWVAPLGGVTGLVELRPPYGNFFLSAG